MRRCRSAPPNGILGRLLEPVFPGGLPGRAMLGGKIAIARPAKQSGGDCEEQDNAAGPAESSVAQQLHELFAGDEEDHGSLSIVHMFEVKAFEVGMTELTGVMSSREAAVSHDANARADFFGTKQVVRGHEHGNPAATEVE